MSLFTIFKAPDLVVLFSWTSECCDPCMNICVSKRIGKGEKGLIAFNSRQGSWKIRKGPHKGHIDVHKDRQLILTATLNVFSRPETDFPG